MDIIGFICFIIYIKFIDYDEDNFDFKIKKK